MKYRLPARLLLLSFILAMNEPSLLLGQETLRGPADAGGQTALVLNVCSGGQPNRLRLCHPVPFTVVDLLIGVRHACRSAFVTALWFVDDHDLSRYPNASSCRRVSPSISRSAGFGPRAVRDRRAEDSRSRSLVRDRCSGPESFFTLGESITTASAAPPIHGRKVCFPEALSR